MEENMSVTAVVLSAGISSRMGKPKQLIPFLGVPMLQAVIQKLLPFPFESIMAVVGDRGEEIRAKVCISDARFRWISNDHYRDGMSTSVIEAVKQCNNESSAGLLVVLGDQPLLTKQTIGTVVDAIRDLGDGASRCVIQTVYRGRPGHPVFIPSALFAHVHELSGDQGAKPLFKYAERRIQVHVGDLGAIADVDTPDDYRNAIRIAELKRIRDVTL
ncbi:nucleotidyltransferase family protein [Paenibacillus thermotolerans]|uniref:nucleotidyltransferase family protein n=1 Tax=Paenibacillus thermotolerans TaxID=3027807 RepID=UPI002368AF45|nr:MULTISPECIES: nucleotidyltransferase family protein [unclassified Paenibacillus]